MAPARSELPGSEIVEAGLRDLAEGRYSVPALVVSIGSPRLRLLGIEVPSPVPDAEHALYQLLADDDPDAAHSRYNALVRRLVSFERSAACARLATAERIRAFLAGLGRSAAEPVTAYLAGGSTAVLLGWRDSTIDVDLKLVPESPELLRAVPWLKEELEINVELASPDLFIPVPPRWEERSPWEAAEGRLTVRHFDLTAQAMAKLERGHARDLEDVAAMLGRGLVTREALSSFLADIEAELYRFPAVDPRSLRRAVEAVALPPAPEAPGRR